jgi:ribonuclease P protein component
MRLKRGSEFARLRAEGRRLTKGCLVANWLELPAGTSSRLGVVAGRKIGEAVVRSRAKRLLRESFRRHQHDLRQPILLVLVARESIRGKAFASVERDFLTALRQARLLKGTS